MSTKIIDYTLDTSSPANPDGSCPATAVGSCPVVGGPHVTTLRDFPKAVNFGGSCCRRCRSPSGTARRRSDSLSSRFALDGQDGLRILPSTFITDNLLKVSRIASLFGQSMSSSVVLPMP